ncbi:MAG: M20/M25/M40 family metallo-hydrolase [Tannerellaceae bacterium]|nr:M20/M25/M40 family metallo-hydrolase [Tannerellaceae bacterium]
MEKNPTDFSGLTDKAPELSVKRLSGGIQIPTISSEKYEETNFEPFDRFKEYLRKSYPLIFQQLKFSTVNTYGLVFHWKGKDPGRNPILFLSHYDVVPVDNYDFSKVTSQETIYQYDDPPASPVQSVQTTWEYPPFSGAVAKGRIYGWGSLDMKGMLFAILEAADMLLTKGFQPEQDIWFAFGHDEEVSRLQGAVYITDYFRKKNLTFDAVYDEGSFLLNLGIRQFSRPLALVGVGEKGMLTLRLRVHGLGGHSSMPPLKSSLVLAAEIIQRLNNSQMPARIIPPIASLIKNVGMELGLPLNEPVFENMTLEETLMEKANTIPIANALIRTTTAITMAKGSEAMNVISPIAEITVNFRLLQGDSVEEVIHHVQEICTGYQVDIETIRAREASGLSPETTRGYEIIGETIHKLYPEALFSSYITIGGTDSYKYQIVSKNIYRFMPVYINQFEQRMIHNTNEYISLENYGKMIAYFKDVMQYYQQ